MPRIQSRLHADELQTTKQLLAEAEEDNKSLRQQLRQQQQAREDAEAKNGALSDELAQAQDDVRSAHTMLSEVQAHYESRERRLQERVYRLERDIHTLEEMVQAARRREAASSPEPQQQPCESCGGLQKELQRVRKEVAQAARASSCEAGQPPLALLAAPSLVVSAKAQNSAAPPSALPGPSAHHFYWQEQLLNTTQQAAACFDVMQRRTHDLCLFHCSGAGDEDPAERWRCQLQDLQGRFDQVVQADAKLISFLVLVAEQQSGEIRRLQQQWSEAQLTVRDVEGVLDEAQVRVHAREEEVAMLRSECAALTDAQLRCQAQLSAQSRDVQTSAAALQRMEEKHTKSVEKLKTQLVESTKLQQQATAYAHNLEAALQEKQQLLESTVAARSAQQKREVLAAAEARVAQFVSHLSRSAQQLQFSLAQLSFSNGVSDAVPLCAHHSSAPRPKAAPSVSSPSPSPPHRLSAAGASSSPSLTRTMGTRSPSSLPYDDSIFLADYTQPFCLADGV
jgi:myosin heavy subunit